MKATAPRKQRQLDKKAWERRRRMTPRRPVVEMLEERRLLAGDSSNWRGPEGEPGSEEAFRAGELVVQFEPNITPAMQSLLAIRNGASIKQSFTNLNMALLQIGDTANVEQAAQTWTALPEVRLAEPNFVEYVNRVPSDSFFNDQYGLNNIGQIPFFGTPDADIDAPEGWDISVGSPDVVVAVLDSGIDLSHPDLLTNIYVNPGEIPGNLIDDDGNGFIDDVSGWDSENQDGDPSDADGHGTHVSGIIAAVGNDGFGVTGVSWNSKIMPLRMGDDAFTIAAQLGAYDYIVRARNDGVNITVSNHSYGGTVFSGIRLAALQQVASAGILIVAAAGNDGTNNDFIPHYPSNFIIPGLISVAASDWDDQLASFSNFGKATVDLAAPGAQILSTIPGGWDYFDGTSMATPMVAGVAAILSALEPSLTPTQLKDIILSSVDKLPWLENYILTGGRLNLRNAIDALPRGAFEGTVYEDINRNGRQDANEFGIPNATVFVDLDNNGVRGPSESFDLTDVNGNFSIANYYGAGQYTIIVAPIVGLDPVTPPGGSQQVISPGRQDVVPGIDFGFQRPGGGQPGGIVWHDANTNRRQDAGEKGIAGVHVFFDLDQDGRMDFGEPGAVTDAKGEFTLPEMPTGAYQLRVITGPSWRLTSPTGAGYHTITFGTGDAASQLADFGLVGGNLLDFGNRVAAGATQGPGTLLADDGARAGILTGFQLGATVNGEADATVDDVNDGISFPAGIVAGVSTNVQVVVSLGGQSRGLLQGWIDFNQDGDWLDAGEQVVKDLRLGEGTHTVSILAPASALTGTAAARFRYGWERGIGPSGPALAGEVEDYAVNVFGDAPRANDDSVSVNQDTTNNVINVLANDFSSSAGGLLVKSVTSPTTRGGTATVSANKLAVVFTPRPNFFGIDSFSYTIEDASGKTDTATVTVNVLPTFAAPQAVDDQVSVAQIPVPAPPSPTRTAINVLANDVLGSNPPTRLSSIVVSPQHGNARIETNGTTAPEDDYISYLPTAGFAGLDQFRYRITDSLGVFSEANVTIFVGDTFSDDLVRYSVQITTTGGAPISQVTVGQDFVVSVFAEDVRTGLPSSDLGVYAAYSDLLYPASTVSVKPPLVFNGAFTINPEGNTSVPGIIDEAGALGDSLNPPGAGPKLVYRATFTALPLTPGQTVTTATFFTDPADDVFDPGPPPVFGLHDTLVYVPRTPADDPIQINDISYLSASITIVASGAVPSGERPLHNSLMPNDVNGDSRVTSYDAITVLRYLRAPQASGEGETAARKMLVDTTGDGKVNMSDAVSVLREIASGKRAAEGEAAVFVGNVSPAAASSVMLVSPAVARPAQSGVREWIGPLQTADRRQDLALGAWLQDAAGTDDLDDDFFRGVLDGWQN